MSKAIILLDYHTLQPVEKYERLKDFCEDMGVNPHRLCVAISRFRYFPLGYLHEEQLAFVLEEDLDKLIAMKGYSYEEFID